MFSIINLNTHFRGDYYFEIIIEARNMLVTENIKVIILRSVTQYFLTYVKMTKYKYVNTPEISYFGKKKFV